MRETEAKYAELTRQRLVKQLRRRAKEMGFELTPVKPPVTPAVAEPAALAN